MNFKEISRRMFDEDTFVREPDDCSRRWESHRGLPTEAPPRWSDEEKAKLKELVERNVTWETISQKVSKINNVYRSIAACQQFYKKRIADAD